MQGSVRRLAGACLGGWQQSLRRLDLLAAEASGERGRSLHASVSAAALDIVVPSMGDSISEGSIAAILKDAGGSVDEDEPILQVETDKVTIDVRAPVQGTLRAITVKEEDTVTVGQIVAILDEAEGGRSSASAAESSPSSSTSSAPSQSDYVSGAATKSPRAQQQSLEELTHAASEVSDSAMRGHKARIRFPPRKTAAGDTISAMPAVDQKTYTARATSQEAQQASREPPQRSLGPSAAPPSSFSKEPVRRRKMLEDEMEAIMLGGAPL